MVSASSGRSAQKTENYPSGIPKDLILILPQEYGKNVLKETKQKSKLAILSGQFKDVIIILILAAIISLYNRRT